MSLCQEKDCTGQHIAMAGAFQTSFTAVVVVVLLLGAAMSITVGAKLDSRCPTGFANFGDSITDTGNALNAFPYIFDAEFSPYGQTFFGKPARRFSNGRLVPDFFSLAFRKPLLDGYFATTAFNYKYGINLAVAAATAAPSPIARVPYSVNPFQVANFIRFKTAASNTELEGKPCRNFIRDLPVGDPYPGWLYTITAGFNDVLNALEHNDSVESIINTTIPAALGNVSAAIQTLYAQSARKFLLFNIPAQGCATVVLTVDRNSKEPKDSLGCITAVNKLSSGYNAGLNRTIQALRKALPDASISLFDVYAVHLEILKNPTTYGFNPNLTLTACCGAPGVGSLNYNPAVTCGHPQNGSNVCSNPDEYVIWDAIHFTEQVYRTISMFALSGKYTDNPVNYTALCNLDFSKFGPKVKLQQAYPDKCNNLFG